MADEQQSIRSVNWRSVFPFTLIFRSFRVAIQPSKIILALVALLSIYTVGRVLDQLWAPSHSAVPNEIRLYVLSAGENGAESFRTERARLIEGLDRQQKAMLKEIGKENGSLKDLRWRITHERDKEVEAVQTAFKAADKSTGPKRESAEKTRDARIRAIYADASDAWKQSKLTSPQGLFDTLFSYEIQQVNSLVSSVLAGNWLGAGGVPESIVNFFVTGPGWALRHHTVFFILFALTFLTIWALFGGAISRIAAVQVARDEKISIRQALRYATDKFVSFFSAPLIPLALLAVFGALIFAGGLLGNIPVVGPIVVSALFVVGLLLAAVITLILIGLGGGFPMMYPTIASEGSDAFDAISRSFSYLYAKPWRMAFYSFVAIVYGALCYLFVRFFLFLLLASAHYFAGAGNFLHAGDGTDLWNNLWPSPGTSSSLVYDIDFINLNWWQDISAFLLAFWVYTTIALLGAFAISFYFSASTTIYFLMRQEVDAIELDDVYLEQSEDDLEVNDHAETSTVETPAGSPAPEAPAAPTEPAPPDPGAAPTT